MNFRTLETLGDGYYLAVDADGIYNDPPFPALFVLDDQGDPLFRVPESLDPRTEETTLVVGQQLLDVIRIVTNEHNRAFALGQRSGEERQIRAVHELLGIDRLVTALADVAVVRS